MNIMTLIITLAVSVALIYGLMLVMSRNRFREHMQRGRDFLKVNETAFALDEFRKCVVIMPQNPESFEMRGKAYKRLGEYPDAKDDLKRALELATGEEYKKKLIKELEIIKRHLEKAKIIKGD